MSYGFTPTMQSLISKAARMSDARSSSNLSCIACCSGWNIQTNAKRNPKTEIRTSKLSTCAQYNPQGSFSDIRHQILHGSFDRIQHKHGIQRSKCLRSSFESSHTAYITNMAAACTWHIKNHGHPLYLLLDHQGTVISLTQLLLALLTLTLLTPTPTPTSGPYVRLQLELSLVSTSQSSSFQLPVL
jgi:hypothetical protein